MRRRILGLSLGAALAVSLALPACDDAKSSAPPADDLRARLLANVGVNVYLPAYRAFATEAVALAAAVDTWDGQPGSAALQARFGQAMLAWQKAELYLAGPAGSSLLYVGGQDLRDAVYSWPTTNPCRVDQSLASEDYARPGYFERSLVNGYGLDALGHLLYAADGGNACPALVRINAEGDWAALGDATVFQRRSAFAKVLAAELVRSAEALVAAWSPGAGDFGARLGRAEGYPSQREALDQVFWGTFYLERTVRDTKVGLPLGLDPACSAEACPDKVELPWGDLALQAIRANLEGYRAWFLGEHPGGSDGIGFDALLEAEGAADFAAQMLSEIDAALAAVDAVQGPLAEAVVQRPAQVTALHTALRACTTSLKTRFVTVLNLTLPQEGAGDND